MSWLEDINLFEYYLSYVNIHFSGIPGLNIYAKYANFVQLDIANKGTPIFLEYPDLWKIVAMWAVGLTMVGAAVKYGAIALFPKWAEGQQNDPKQRLAKMNVNVTAFVHHIIVSTVSLYYIYKDMTSSGPINYTSEHGYLFAISQGYIISDFIMYATPHMDISMIIHHILVLFIPWGFIVAYEDYPAFFLRYIPYCNVCETSGIFFLANQFLSQVGIERGKIVNALKLGFAFFFLLFRIISLPLVSLIVLYAPWKVAPSTFVRSSNFNVMCLVTYLFLSMQFMWMYKIILAGLKGDIFKRSNLRNIKNSFHITKND